MLGAVSAPHNFLKVTDTMQEQTKTREWIIARIVRTDEAVASGGEVSDTRVCSGLIYRSVTLNQPLRSCGRPALLHPSRGGVQPRCYQTFQAIGLGELCW